MEEIKVGEYIRTKTQGICKLIANEKDASGRYVGYVDKPFFLREDNILKHHPNIVELLEEHDYINGCEVVQVTATHLIVRDEDGLAMWGKDWTKIHIKYVVTHEQFNSIKYTVKE